MISDTITILTDSTLIETAHLIVNDTLFIKIQHCSTSSAEQSTILDYVLKNGITIILALIAGMVALYQVKSNVISTARMKWMDELRVCISELSNAIVNTATNHSNMKKADKSNMPNEYKQYLSSHSQVNILASRLHLLLDSENKLHSQIEKLILEINTMISSEDIDSTKKKEIVLKLNQIIILSKQIFKEEWKRSKKVFKL